MKSYCDYLEKIGTKQNTITAYSSRIKLLLLQYPNAEKGITQEIIDQYINHNNLSTSTISQTIYAAKKFNEIILNKNISLKSKPIVYNKEKQNDIEKTGFYFEKVKQTIELYDEPIKTRTKAIIYFLYYTGARIGEAQLLLISDIDFDNNMIFIKGQKSKDRTIPIHKNLKEVLINYLKITNSEYVFLSHGKNHKNNQLAYGSIRNIVKKVLHDSGYMLQSSHVFRYVFITNLFKNGAYIEDIKLLTGHSKYGDLEHYFIGDKSGEQAIEAIF